MPVDNIDAQIIFVNHILKHGMISNFDDVVVVSPDANGVTRYNYLTNNILYLFTIFIYYIYLQYLFTYKLVLKPLPI